MTSLNSKDNSKSVTCGTISLLTYKLGQNFFTCERHQHFLLCIHSTKVQGYVHLPKINPMLLITILIKDMVGILTYTGIYSYMYNCVHDPVTLQKY